MTAGSRKSQRLRFLAAKSVARFAKIVAMDLPRDRRRPEANAGRNDWSQLALKEDRTERPTRIDPRIATKAQAACPELRDSTETMRHPSQRLARKAAR